MELYSHLNNPLVRALAWAITSPPLLCSNAGPQSPLKQTNLIDLVSSDAADVSNWLIHQDKQPRSLENWIALRPTKRVGHFFEHLVHYWLVHQPNIQLLTHHQQLIEGNRTLGELDFLFRSESKTIHLETAIKFYLKANNQQSLKSFVGPNNQDNLSRKNQHLIHKQLPLGQHTIVKTHWNISSKIDSLAFFKGYLFYPTGHIPTESTDLGLTPNHPRGFWSHSHDLSLPHGPKQWLWKIVNKPYWIGPYRAQENAPNLLTTEALRSCINLHFAKHNAPLLVVYLRPHGQKGWEESHRGIIVAKSWPNTD